MLEISSTRLIRKSWLDSLNKLVGLFMRKLSTQRMEKNQKDLALDFTNPEDAEQAIKTYHDSFMHGRRMRVAQAFRKNEQPPQTAPDNKGKKDDKGE